MKWVASRKARLLHAIEDGEMTDMDAYIKYGVTGPELKEWREKYNKYGMRGLRVTQIKKYRSENVTI